MASGMPLTRDYATGVVSRVDETTDTVNAQTIAPSVTNADIYLDANGTGVIRVGFNGGGVAQDARFYGDLNVDGAEIVTGGVTFNGDVTLGDAAADELIINATLSQGFVIYDPTNDGNPEIRIGSSDTDEVHLQTVFDAGAQTLNYFLIDTDSTTTGDIVLNANVGIATTDLDGTPAIGRLTVKGSTNDGSTNCLVLRDSAEANVFLVNTDGFTTINDGIYCAGKFVEVALKNRSQIYIQDSDGDVLSYQNYYYSGGFIATNSYGFGHGALQNNTGAYSNGFGLNVLQNNTGANSNGFGRDALQNNTGANSNGFGYYALRSNTGASSNGFGFYALQNNTGASSNGFGYYALQANTGDYSTGFGYQALQNNTGAYSNGFGLNVLQNNIGDYSTGFGHQALQNNTGAYSNGFGFYALQNNTGANSIGFGYQTLRYCDADNNIAIGYDAWASFIQNTSGNKTFDNTDINVGLDQITVTAHGFGANGTYHNIKYTEGSAPITGLTDGDIIQAYIVDANTIQVDRTNDITAAGAGVGHTLTPQYEYTNSIVIGASQDPTASNQVILGNSSITQTILRGIIITDQGTDIASANDAAVPDGNYCDVTGAVQINTMAVTGLIAGTEVTLQFDSNPVVKHATAGAGAQFQLAGSADFNTTAGDTLTVVYDGTYWREKSRVVI